MISAFVVAGGRCSTAKVAVGCTKLKYRFPFAVRGFAGEVFIGCTTSLVVCPGDNDLCCSVNTMTPSFCALSDVQAACQDATVTQELLKEGFHR